MGREQIYTVKVDIGNSSRSSPEAFTAMPFARSATKPLMDFLYPSKMRMLVSCVS